MEKVISPKGELEWVTINDGKGKESLSGKDQYLANVVLEADDPFFEEIQRFWEENKPKGYKKEPKSLGWYEHKAATGETDDEGKKVYAEDGKRYVAFKTGIAYADGSEKNVKIFNAKGRPVSLGDKKIGNGSVGQVGGAMAIYTTTDKSGKTIVTAGVTFYLNSIKIIKLEEFSGQDDFEEDAEAEGWTGEDDSFEGNEEATVAPAKSKVRL